MNEEPEFLSQTGDPMTQEQRMEWFRWRAADAAERGATFHRFSIFPEMPHVILHEGWKARPQDQGEPRFQMCESQSGSVAAHMPGLR